MFRCLDANGRRHLSMPLVAMAMMTLWFWPAASSGQEKPKGDGVEVLTRGFEDWMRENFDRDLLDALSQVDQERTLQIFSSLLRKFDANDIYDLGSARESAVRLLPVLKQFEETQPFAGWLETRLDYFEASEALRRLVQVTPPKPGTPQHLPAPTQEAQRKVWTERLSKRPVPAGAQALVPRIKPIFRSAGIPAELIWLAEVESSFNPKARSPKGAAGLFQLMPTTARSLGLSTWPFDERLDPDRNATAAAKYLRYLYGRFADWRLVLAAYNAGEGRVGQLLEGAKPRSFAAIASRLPAETQLYVPKFEATLRKREEVSITSLGKPREMADDK
jgi:membrane-bound lytic murein transglycosylase D